MEENPLAAVVSALTGGTTLVPLRVATTCSSTTADAMHDAIAELVQEVHARNDLAPEAIRVVLFTTTADLRAIKPARVARAVGWPAAEYLCLAEMPTDDDLPRCIRALLLVDRPAGAAPLRPVYLRDAVTLRPA